MLLQRIITASILATLIIASILLPQNITTLQLGGVKLTFPLFSLVMSVIILIGAWEWMNLISVEKSILKIVFLLSLFIPMLAVTFWTQFLELIAHVLEWQDVKEFSGIIEWSVIPPVLFWIMVMILIRQVPSLFLKLELKSSYRVLTGWFILFTAWMFASRLHLLYGYEMMLYFLILIWMADIAAYFVGKKFGKDKLAPEISPGKTIQGMYGALVSSAVCGILLSLIYGFSVISSIDFILLSVLTVLLSIYGDLFFSLIKRQKGVKDSGVIFPGHGGVLDRIDSVVAASPFFYAGITLIGLGVFE